MFQNGFEDLFDEEVREQMKIGAAIPGTFLIFFLNFSNEKQLEKFDEPNGVLMVTLLIPRQT